MGTLFFIIKTTVMTALLILLLQVKWDGVTLEQRTLYFIRSSSLTQPIEKTANSIVHIFKSGTGRISDLFDGKFFKSQERVGNREARFHLERSKEYLKKSAEEGRQAARNSINKFIDESKLGDQSDLTSEEEDIE